MGYPTQKPVLLLEQIIQLVTNEGDIVLDPFCGSGTTCVAAMLLGRQYIGIDKSDEAVELSKARIGNPIKTESNLLKKGRDSYLNADKEALSLLNGLQFNPVQRNKGIDAILVEQFDNAPILVRVQKDQESIDEAASLLAKAMKTKKSKKSFLIQTQLNTGLFNSPPNFEGMILLDSPALQIKRANKALHSDEFSAALQIRR